MKEYKSHKESDSTEVENVQLELEEIHQILANCYLDNIYNMHETGSYFPLQPDRSVTHKQLQERKKDKQRITVALTCHGTGSDQLPPCIIGMTENSHQKLGAPS